ncbi:type VI secretion system tip protein VgrG, partial [Caballeronia zhejiangensis]|nr:type VI secretion system tip protein VgrG [Caballeronia zhejiangensis]
ARDDKTTYGQSYTWGSRHLDADAAKFEAQLRHEEALSGQIRFDGKSTVSAFCPGLVVRLDEKLPDAPHGMVLSEVIHEAGRDKSYHNTFRAIPAERPYRIPMQEHSWPKIVGTLSARVTTRDDSDYAELDENGRGLDRSRGRDALRARSDGPIARAKDRQRRHRAVLLRRARA